MEVGNVELGGWPATAHVAAHLNCLVYIRMVEVAWIIANCLRCSEWLVVFFSLLDFELFNRNSQTCMLLGHATGAAVALCRRRCTR